MSEWGNRKLKTLKQLRQDFKGMCKEWDDRGDVLFIMYSKPDWRWYIGPMKKSKFGTEIKVKKIYDTDYTHICNDGWLWHELWFEPKFEPIEFIKEEEFSM